MQNTSIALHLGALQTDNNQLIWSLRKDATALLERGILVRRPGTYQTSMHQLLEKQAHDGISDEEKEVLLSRIVKNTPTSRLILSSTKAFGTPTWMLNDGQLFSDAGRNTQALRNLFPDNDCEFFFGVQNPATLISSVFNAQSERSADDFMSNIDATGLRWSDVVRDIVESNPGCPVTIWCNEETPALWPTILRHVIRQNVALPLGGEFDIVQQILPDVATKRLSAYLLARPHFTHAQKEKIITIFIERFCSDDAVEEEIDLPGWTQEIIDATTNIYLNDIEELRQIPGVTFLQ